MGTINAATSGAPTGNIYVDSLVWTGSWAPALGQGTTLTWTIGLTATAGGVTVTGREWQSHELTALRQVLQAWSNVSGLVFDEKPAGTAGTDLVEMLPDAAGKLAVEFEPDDQGQHSTPDGSSPAPLYGFYNDAHPTWTEASLGQGGAAFGTVLHEFGHGLGMAHPHDGGGDGQVFPGVVNKDSMGTHKLNQGVFTVMSYLDGWKAAFPNHAATESDYGYAMTPMALDIAAIQAIYGANTTFAAGDDAYLLPKVNAAGTGWSSIWDTGGTDTISADGATTKATIDLREAPLTGPHAGGYVSSVSGIVGGVTIAKGAIVENAIGGAGDDTITGNGAANRLDGGNGKDRLAGGAGDDTYVLDDAGDRIIELAGEGTDTVIASVNEVLNANIENLILVGTALTGKGNELNNSLTGNSLDNRLDGGGGDDTLIGGAGGDKLLGGDGADRLEGGAGLDVLTGGAGADSFVFGIAPENAAAADRVADFTSGEDRILLDHVVFMGGPTSGALGTGALATGLRAGEGDDRAIYDSTTGFLRWDADGRGGGAPIFIAKLDPGLALTAADIWMY